MLNIEKYAFADCVNPDQTAPTEAVLSGLTLLASQAIYLEKNKQKSPH